MSRIAVIIPTRNRPVALGRCLDSLMPALVRHPGCSVLVTDDGDADKTRAALAGRFAGITILQGPGRGPAANRNHGALRTTGDLIVFLDDDCLPGPDLLDAYQAAAERLPDVEVFEGRISARGDAAGFADVCPVNESGGYLWSCNMAIRRELFFRIGGFDERYPFAAMEDMDLHLRVKAHAQIVFIREARVWHDVEVRAGNRLVRHRQLSALLYFQLHGLKRTGQTPLYFLHDAARLLLLKVPRFVRQGKVKNPAQVVLDLIADLKMAVILFAWRHRARLARHFFPPCCAGCQQIHAKLAASLAEHDY